MRRHNTYVHGILGMVGSVIAILLMTCVFMVSVANAQLDHFAAEMEQMIWLDILHFWDDEDDLAVAARSVLADQAQTSIKNGLDEMLTGQNLDPGQRYVWRSAGVGGFQLDYPRPNFPEVTLRSVGYWKVPPSPDELKVVFVVGWNCHWEGLSHAVHNGPYIKFRLMGGWATWTRNNDVWVEIDRMDMNIHGTTWYVVNTPLRDGRPDHDEASVRTLNYGISTEGGFLRGINYHTTFTNPNRYGYKERLGNRIIREIENNYADRIKSLIYNTLLKDFITWRFEEGQDIASSIDFWSDQVRWALRESEEHGELNLE